MNLSRHEARNAVQNLGGDMVAVVQRLTELKAADDRWVVHFEIDTVTKEFRRLFFMTPTQVELGRRFGDVVINDVAL